MSLRICLLAVLAPLVACASQVDSNHQGDALAKIAGSVRNTRTLPIPTVPRSSWSGRTPPVRPISPAAYSRTRAFAALSWSNTSSPNPDVGSGSHGATVVAAGPAQIGE